MLPAFEGLYQDMLDELGEVERLSVTATVKAEQGYRIAMEYWRRVRERFEMRVIQDDTEEIEFFRNTKPWFTAYIEYHLIINHAVLFNPVDPLSVAGYWELEAKREDRYLVTNRDFIQYLESGATDRDPDYFLARNNKREVTAQERMFEDEDCRSSHDGIIRSKLALELYRRFLDQGI